MAHQHRVVFALAGAKALFQTNSVLIMTIGGLAGQLLAPERSLATLPIAMAFLGTALSTIPASLLMARVGRRAGFVSGALIGALGGGVATAGMFSGSFGLLCLGVLLMGVNQGFAQFYRFAAAEASSAAFRSRAVSLVLAGGVFAAFAGPNLGAFTRDLFSGGSYAGSFAAAVVLSLVATAILAATPLPDSVAVEADPEPPRDLGVIARQPGFLAAILGATAGQAVMVLVMTATPLSMLSHGHSVADAAFVIQWHVLAMFGPSFFTGWLIKRCGVMQIMLGGLGMLTAEVAIVASGTAMSHFAIGLVLLGVGWNFLYVGGSTLLLETYRPSERGKVQALYDFVIVGVTAAGAFSAGAFVEMFGWRGLNLALLAPLLAAGVAVGVATTLRALRVSSPAPVRGAPGA